MVVSLADNLVSVYTIASRYGSGYGCSLYYTKVWDMVASLVEVCLDGNIATIRFD